MAEEMLQVFLAIFVASEIIGPTVPLSSAEAHVFKRGSKRIRAEEVNCMVNEGN
jgi:hypothetical protein